VTKPTAPTTTAPTATAPTTTAPTTTAPATAAPTTAHTTTAAPATTEPAAALPTQETQGGDFPAAPFLFGGIAAVAALLAGAGAYWFLSRRNVNVFMDRDGKRALVAKDKISAKSPVIDLTPLDGERFNIEIEKHAAKAMSGQTVEVRRGLSSLKHKIAYEGSAYSIEADFVAGTVQAIH
jgi:hypothetical protein